MKLYQRGRVWYLTFYVRGKRVQESTGTSDRRKAEKFCALRLSEVERSEYYQSAKISLAQFGQQYLEYAKANKRSWLRDEQIMAHLNTAMGPTKLGDIGALQIERYKLDRLQQSASPATVNREVALLKHMFNMAEHWQLFFGRNPVRGVKFLEEDNLQIRSLSEAEQEKLLQCCSPYLQDLVTFAINTGLRLGEILNLRWEEVDLENAVIKMLVRKNRRMLEVPLNDTAVAVVNGWCGLRKCEFVFYNPETGGQWKDLWLGLKKACRKAGLDDLTWHTFRHTFATRLTRSGVDLVTVKELLGHSSVSVTMRYAHTNRDAKKRAVALIAGRNGAKLVTVPVLKTKKVW
jgi:integrase